MLITLSEFIAFLWFSRFNIEIVIYPNQSSEKLLSVSLDFVFVVNLLIHKISYSVFKVHGAHEKALWWRIRGSNP